MQLIYLIAERIYKIVLLAIFLASATYGQNCKGIGKKIFKSSGNTSYVGVAKGRLFASGDTNEIDILIGRKFITIADTVYDMTIIKTINKAPIEENRKGVSLLLDDGSLIEHMDYPIGVSKMAGHLVLVAEFRLNEEEVYKLSQNTVTGIKLIKSNNTVYSKMAESFKVNAACMLHSW